MSNGIDFKALSLDLRAQLNACEQSKAELLEALELLSKSAPSACCVDFHHQPGDYHGPDEACPALYRYEAACLSARVVISKARGEA